MVCDFEFATWNFLLELPMYVEKKLTKAIGQTKNGLVSGRLACTSSKIEICTEQNRNLDFNPEFSS